MERGVEMEGWVGNIKKRARHSRSLILVWSFNKFPKRTRTTTTTMTQGGGTLIRVSGTFNSAFDSLSHKASGTSIPAFDSPSIGSVVLIFQPLLCFFYRFFFRLFFLPLIDFGKGFWFSFSFMVFPLLVSGGHVLL